MAVFAIHYTYPDDPTAMLTVRPQHRAWLSSVPGLLVAGMYQPGRDEVPHDEAGGDDDQSPANGALIVVSGDSLAEVVTAFDHDPYWLGGFVLRRVVREWNPPLGAWVADPVDPTG